MPRRSPCACQPVSPAETTALTTPSFTATTGEHYETCAFFHVRETPTQVVDHSGCSPFAVA
ncbi:hypothetical protein [Actinoallomurus iriomotensis]|uniref:hypothetical protein n=1 Tax=Actinoallomurus iriomotensis TaxID=478107 RepID=UPI002552CE84|nr:hypothetical protein [Actinoallomurus iriomotensis]